MDLFFFLVFFSFNVFFVFVVFFFFGFSSSFDELNWLGST